MLGERNWLSAYEHAQAAIAAHPDFVPALELRGRALRALGRHAEALASFERVTEVIPGDVQALVDQAGQHLELGQSEDARDCFEIALAHAPDCVAALAGLARLLRNAGATELALDHIRHALRAMPQDAELHFESALTHNRCGDVDGACAAYERALELQPAYAAAAVNLGLIYLSQLGDPRRAQQYFEQALEVDPRSVAAQANLGAAMQEQGRLDDALAHYKRLIAAQPEVVEFRWNRGIALLSRGNYAQGWEDYELRRLRGAGAPARTFHFPEWQGEALGNATLLVYAEQGLGDEIMFAGCLPDLLARGANCVIECDKRLGGLFARSFPAAHVHGAARDDRSWIAQHTDIGRQIAIGSLPRLLRRDEADFPRHRGYLRAEPRRVAYWRGRLNAHRGESVVGLAWRGGTLKTRDRLRSIALDPLASLFDVGQCIWVNLQRGGENEFAALASAKDGWARSYPEALDDLDETAALIEALDCVVSVDNTVVHLAGALGRPVLVMLPWHADWRWLCERRTSPWYPSAVLFRQTRPGEWTPAIQAVATALRSLK